MADGDKGTALPALTAITDDDLFLVVDDPSGTPSTKSVTSAILAKYAGTYRCSSDPTPVDGMWIHRTDIDTVKYYDGTGWVIVAEPWQSYNTFTATNVTLGNGTKTGRYRRSLGSVQFELDLTFGSTTTLGTVGNPVSFSLPMNVTDSVSHRYLVGYLYDSSAGVLCPSFWFTAVNGATLTPTYLYSITQVQNNGVYAGAPWTWGSGDQIRISGTLPMSSMYS